MAADSASSRRHGELYLVGPYRGVVAAREHLHALTGLRFVAALHVVLFHFARPLAATAPWPWHGLTYSGYVGVSLFFVLSGFVLAYSYLSPDSVEVRSKREFWIARFARVYPVYLLGLILSVPMFIQRRLPLNTAYSWAELGTLSGLTLTLTQSWLPWTARVWNKVAWSLSVEAFFYALFPFVAVLLVRAPTRRLLLISGALWGASLLLPFGYTMLNPAFNGSQGALGHMIMFNPLMRLPEFLIGMVAGLSFVRQRQNEVRSARWGYVATLAVLTWVGLLTISDHIPFLPLHNSLLAPLFALMIYAVGSGTGWIVRCLSSPICILLGEASYALYIIHVPLAVVFGWAGLVPETMAGLLLLVLLMVGVSVVVLRTVETPARLAIRRRLAGRKREAIGTTTEEQLLA